MGRRVGLQLVRFWAQTSTTTTAAACPLASSPTSQALTHRSSHTKCASRADRVGLCSIGLASHCFASAALAQGDGRLAATRSRFLLVEPHCNTLGGGCIPSRYLTKQAYAVSKPPEHPVIQFGFTPRTPNPSSKHPNFSASRRQLFTRSPES